MRKVIFDCDTGSDDAIALMILLLSNQFDVLGVTCTRGNQPAEYTSRNSLDVLNLLNSDVKVYKGVDEPMYPDIQKIREKVMSEGPISYFDEKGIEHHLHPKKFWIEQSKRNIEDKHAVDFIIDTCMNSIDKVTIIIVGPASNVGCAIKKEPRIVEHIEEFVFMGGGVDKGNVTKYAEANFFHDPDAVKTILDTNIHCVMASLNGTHACAITINQANQMIQAESKYTRFAGEIVKWRADVECHLGWTDGMAEPVHDPLAVCYLIDKNICKKVLHCQVDIDTSTGLRAGSLLINTGKGNPNVDIMMDVDNIDYYNMWRKYLG